MEDEKIFEVFNEDIDKGLALLVDNYSYTLYKLCNNLCKTKVEADDLFQETWVKVFSNIQKFNKQSKFKTWLFTICINCYRDKYRKNKRWLNISFNFFKDGEKDLVINNKASQDLEVEALVIKKDEKERLKNFITELDDIYRLPLILYYFKNLSYKEIAIVLDIKEGTVKSRLSTAKEKLKIKIGGEL